MRRCCCDHKQWSVQADCWPFCLLQSAFPVLCCASITLQGGDECRRCDGNGIPHSPHAHFFKCADVVVQEANVKKLNKAVLQAMEGEGFTDRRSRRGLGLCYARLACVFNDTRNEQSRGPGRPTHHTQSQTHTTPHQQPDTLPADAQHLLMVQPV